MTTPMRFMTIPLSLLVLLGAATSASAQTTFKVDPVHSFVTFEIAHLDLIKAWGRFNDPAGTITWDEANPTNSRIEVTLQAAKIDTGNQKRDDHLRSPDFFNVKQFPTITFKSTSIAKKSDNEYEVTGDLTMHGVTKPITVALSKTAERETPMGYRAGFQSSFTVKRSDFGMTFMQGPLGDEVTLHVALESVRQ